MSIIDNMPAATPSWVAQSQSNVVLKKIGGSINYNTQVSNKPAKVT